MYVCVCVAGYQVGDDTRHVLCDMIPVRFTVVRAPGPGKQFWYDKISALIDAHRLLLWKSGRITKICQSGWSPEGVACHFFENVVDTHCVYETNVTIITSVSPDLTLNPIEKSPSLLTIKCFRLRVLIGYFLTPYTHGRRYIVRIPLGWVIDRSFTLRTAQ